MTNRRQKLGRYGEDLVAGYLAQRGWQILERNYRCRWGELDLVARDAECLVFVEVRTRRGDAFGTAVESVTERKIARLVASAQTYVQEHSLEGQPWRIDVAALEMTPQGGVRRLEILQNAVEL